MAVASLAHPMRSRQLDGFVAHGLGVETTPEWFCEAAWAGEYQRGDFDRTDIVAGTGGRIRNGTVVFVSAGLDC